MGIFPSCHLKLFYPDNLRQLYVQIYFYLVSIWILYLREIVSLFCMQSGADKGIEHATYMVSAFSACSITSKACHKLRSCLTYCCLC